MYYNNTTQTVAYNYKYVVKNLFLITCTFVFTAYTQLNNWVILLSSKKNLK